MMINPFKLCRPIVTVLLFQEQAEELSLRDIYRGKFRVLRKGARDKIPMILCGYFNINFSSKRTQQVIQFLNSKFGLKTNNGPSVPTTKSGSTTDIVGYSTRTRYQYVSYFSYHKPRV